VSNAASGKGRKAEMTEGYKERKILRSSRGLPSEPEEGTDYQDYLEPPVYFTEGYKLLVDASKQLTTLNAGSIVVIGTFLKDIFPTDQGILAVGPFIKGLIAASFVCFGVSLILAAFIMLYFSRSMNMAVQRAVWEAQLGSPERELRWYEKDLQWDPHDRVLRWVPHREPVDVITIELTTLHGRLFNTLKELFTFKLLGRLSLLPLPFFTAGLLCFGIAVVLNLYR